MFDGAEWQLVRVCEAAGGAVVSIAVGVSEGGVPRGSVVCVEGCVPCTFEMW